MSDVLLTETVAQLGEAAVRGDGTLDILVISPGVGSSGLYEPAVLEAVARGGIAPAGTHLYMDHPSRSETVDRPERSIRDLAAAFTEDARWEEAGPEGPGLYARAKVLGPYRELIDELAPHIGVSIRARGRAHEGERPDGSVGLIVDEITEIESVDFVTKAGRGGKVLQLLESARGTVKGEGEYEDGFTEADGVSQADRDKYHAAGHTLPDKSYPIPNVAFLKKAVQAYGRAKDKARVKKWIIKRARALKRLDLLPDAWNIKESAVAKASMEIPIVVTMNGEDVTDQVSVALRRMSEAGTDSELVEARNVGQWGEACIHLYFTQWADDLYGNGKLTREERIALSSAIGEALDAFTASLQSGAPQLYKRSPWTDPETPDDPAMQEEASVPDDVAARLAEAEKTITALAEALKAKDEQIATLGTRLERQEDKERLREAADRQRDTDKLIARLAEQADIPAGLSPVAARIRARAATSAGRDVPLDEAGLVNREALAETVTKAVAAEVAEFSEVAGLGKVRDISPVAAKTEITDADLAEAFAALGMSESASKVAAAGR